MSYNQGIATRDWKALWIFVSDLFWGGGFRVQETLLSSQVATTHRLEGHNDISNLQVSFLLQVGQNSSAEEDFALPNSIQVGVEFQGFDLQRAEEFPTGPCGQWGGVFKNGPIPCGRWK
jgi:hypothetical protein